MNESPDHMVKMTAKAKYDKTTFSKISRWYFISKLKIVLRIHTILQTLLFSCVSLEPTFLP